MRRVFDRLIQNKIFKSSAGLLTITLIVKLLGYVEKLVLAKYYGTSYQVDVYTMVVTLVLSVFFFFREIVEPSFLNVFLDAKIKGDESSSWVLFNKCLRLIFFITLVISVASFIFPQSFVIVFAPGFEGVKLKLSEELIRIAIPASIFLAISTLTSITLNGLKIFVLPASGELAFKGLIIVCMILFYKQYGIIGAGIGILIGSVGRLVVHLTKLYKKISFKKIEVESKYKRRVWQLAWPLLFGVSLSQISSLIDNILASYLQEGAIAALSYARKVVELPVIIFPYVISVVIFPYFTQLSVEKNLEKLKDLLANSLKWIVIVFLPIAAFFFVFSTPLIEIIFERGAFNAASTILTARPLMVYSLGLVFFAIETILVIFYYANADTKTPVFVGMICVVLHIALSLVLIKIMGYIGIALSFVIQKSVKNLVLLYLVRQKVSYRMPDIWHFLIKILLSFLVFIAIILFGNMLLYNFIDHKLVDKIGIMVLSSAIGGYLYILILQKTGLIESRGVIKD